MIKNNNQDHYRLFIDELGTGNTKDLKSQLYILAGCSINDNERNNIEIWSDRIKFKYWGNTNIIFHSREIGRKDGDFSILKNKIIYKEFIKDLEIFLVRSKFKLFFVIVDKEDARKMAWNDIKIYKETSSNMIRNFLLILLSSDSRGKIIIESATAQKDFYIHKAVGHFLAEGLKSPKTNYKKIQDVLTSISFVTKKNYDIEEQIADLFAYAAKCRYLIKKKRRFKKGSYEIMMLNLLNKKIFKKPRKSSIMKKKYFDEVDSFIILP
ncbi:DUF3800 domain-containing protein [bacterium]|nr:DUF3800 domain-containing protein [bacterium]